MLSCGLDDRGSISGRYKEGVSSLLHRFQTSYEASPASYPIGTGSFFPGVKQPGREADHSPPSSAEVKNPSSYTSVPPIRLHVFMEWDLVKSRASFIFTS
jgi:hypothetical protein